MYRLPKCKYCRQPFEPVKIDQKFCSHRCRQAAYRKRRNRAKRPVRPAWRQGRRAGERTVIPTTCLHCNGSFWAKSKKAKFCSTSCRTLYHRALKTAIPDAISMLYGLPEAKAWDVIETQPIGNIRRLLEGAGYRYIHHERRWMQPLG